MLITWFETDLWKSRLCKVVYIKDKIGVYVMVILIRLPIHLYSILSCEFSELKFLNVLKDTQQQLQEPRIIWE